MMKIIATFLLLGTASSFSTAPSSYRNSQSSIISSHRASTAADADAMTDQDHFYRAVEIADNIRSSNSKMDVEELDRWATELETIEGCLFEDGSDQELCDREMSDRLEVAQILRLEIELMLRLDYLKNHSNLFADDVRKNHNKVERQKFKKALLENREKMPNDDGSDLGLW
jgi:hypothetical protein